MARTPMEIMMIYDAIENETMSTARKEVQLEDFMNAHEPARQQQFGEQLTPALEEENEAARSLICGLAHKFFEERISFSAQSRGQNLPGIALKTIRWTQGRPSFSQLVRACR